MIDKKAIRHWIEHGSQGCRQCNRGFREWGFVRMARRRRKAG